MGYWLSNGRYGNTQDVILFGATPRTGPAQSDAVETDRGVVRLTLDVAPGSGQAATLDIVLETRRDGADPWRPVGTFPQVAAPGTLRRTFAGIDRQLRALAVPAAGATLTYSLVGELV